MPAPLAPVGERRVFRVIAGDVSLTRESARPKLDPQRPARAHRLDGRRSTLNEVVVVVALRGGRARGPAAVAAHEKSWDVLGLSEGVSVYAQVKASRAGRDGKSWPLVSPQYLPAPRLGEKCRRRLRAR